jgi:hypothetical protein
MTRNRLDALSFAACLAFFGGLAMILWRFP